MDSQKNRTVLGLDITFQTIIIYILTVFVASNVPYASKNNLLPISLLIFMILYQIIVSSNIQDHILRRKNIQQYFIFYMRFVMIGFFMFILLVILFPFQFRLCFK